MEAKIIILVDGSEYEYGRYVFETDDQKNKVNRLAEKISAERGVQTYVQRCSG